MRDFEQESADMVEAYATFATLHDGVHYATMGYIAFHIGLGAGALEAYGRDKDEARELLR